jgi:uncharacterized protein YecT (DUF1311 family)
LSFNGKLNGLPAAVGFLGLLVSVLCCTGASAFDCAKASTTVERAICADSGLKAADDRLSNLYFSLLSRSNLLVEFTGDDGSRARLLDTQRVFVATRERDCSAGGPDEIKSCTATKTAARIAEFDKLSQYGPGDSQTALALRDYKIGGETITLASDSELPDQKLMRHKGAKLLSGRDFFVRDIWKGVNVAAILVETYDGGTDQCRSIDIVETRSQGVVKATSLGGGCAFGPHWGFRRTPTGFAFETQAQPLDDGFIVEWNAPTGTVAKRPTKFTPESGLTMEGLLQSSRPQYRDPLTTAEFYDAVQSLPVPDRTRALQSLWNIGDACDCSSDDRLGFYGAQIEADFVAYSTCGWYLRASRVRCQDTDALAVWDRKTRKAYFALDDHIISGQHARSRKLRLYPALDQWPPLAVAKFEAWKNGAIWDPSMNGAAHP